MNKCIKCGSYAFNLYKEDIDQGGLCDVHYWQGRAHRAEALAQPEHEPTNLERHERNVQKFLGTQQPKEPEQDEYLSKAYRLANELRCHLAIAPAPQRTWVRLTDKDIGAILEDPTIAEKHQGNWLVLPYSYARAVEAKLKEKNT